jgi:hypothetical protein
MPSGRLDGTRSCHGISLRIADERGRVIDDIILPNQRIDRRNPGLRDEHQFEAKRAPDVDERRRPRSTTASVNVVLAQPRYTRIVHNTLSAITPFFSCRLQQQANAHEIFRL